MKRKKELQIRCSPAAVAAMMLALLLCGCGNGDAGDEQASGEGYALKNVSDPALVEAAFGAPQDEVTAAYDYTLQENEEDAFMPYTVEAELTFTAGGETCTIPVSGEVDAMELGDELTFLTGPLYGEAELGGVSYQVSAGFNKVLERDGASFSMVLTLLSGDVGGMTFYFGDEVMTDDVQAALGG